MRGEVRLVWARAVLCGTAMLSIAAALAVPTRAAEAAGLHADQHAAAGDPARSVASYRAPDVVLTRDDGRVVGLRAELDDSRPVVLAFVYTTCTAICPLTSQTLATLQQKLGPARERVHIMSISIDPEQDTPERLRAYAQRYHASAAWQHYTGTRAASEATQRAFDAYRGSKMGHQPVILVRATPGGDWVRLDGFPTADEVLAELPQTRAAR